jgi:type 1 glutamine amidotransferase
MWPEWNKMIALNWQPNTYGEGIKIEGGKVVHIPKGEGPGAGHGPQHEYDCQLLNSGHPITQGMPAKWHHTKDELYHGQRGPAQNMDVLVYGFDDPATTQGKGTGQNEPLVYTVSYGKSRVFVNLMGHDAPQTDQPDMIALMTRGTEWAATGKVTLPLPENFK